MFACSSKEKRVSMHRHSPKISVRDGYDDFIGIGTDFTQAHGHDWLVFVDKGCARRLTNFVRSLSPLGIAPSAFTTSPDPAQAACLTAAVHKVGELGKGPHRAASGASNSTPPGSSRR